MKKEKNATAGNQEQRRGRWWLLIPLVAMTLIAPTACYYDEYGPYSSLGGYGYGPPQAGPYYGRGGYDDHYYDRPSVPYYPSSYRNHSGHYERYDDWDRQRDDQRAKQENQNEHRKESANEGWRYEPRNEARIRGGHSSGGGGEENKEEGKKR